MDLTEYYWLIGVLLACVASFTSNLGVNLQKLGHLRQQSKGADASDTSYTKSPVWRTGMALVVLGSLFDFVALGFGKQSIIAPLGSLTLVSNVFFAPWLLKEKVTRQDVMATAVIIFGCVIAVAFASHQDTVYTVDEIFEFYTRPRFVVYALITSGVMFFMWSAIKRCEVVRATKGKDSTQYAALSKYHRFLYAALSGTIGAQNVLFAKCTAELLINTFSGEAVMFAHVYSYLIIAGLGVTIFLQIRWLNAGLALFDALVVVPIFQCFWILVSVVSGLIFFGEYAEMSATQAIMFPLGVLFVILGVVWLSHRNVSDHAPSADGQDAPLTSTTGNIHLESSSHHRIQDPAASPIHNDNTKPQPSRSRLKHAFDTVARVGSDMTSLHPFRDEGHFDESLGFLGKGAPAAFGGSAMARMSTVMTHEHADAHKFQPLLGADELDELYDPEAMNEFVGLRDDDDFDSDHQESEMSPLEHRHSDFSDQDNDQPSPSSGVRSRHSSFHQPNKKDTRKVSV